MPRWQTVWIVGASTGIGREVALQLAKSGVRVIASARSSDKLEALAARSDNITALPLDVTDGEAVARAARHIEQNIAPIDLLLCCAAIWLQVKSDELRVEDFETTMQVNVLGYVRALVAVLPFMRARGCGQIGLMSSVAGYCGLPRSAAYGASKAALINMAESLKPELDKAGISIHIINPGFVETPLTDKNDFPMPFIIKPEEAAQRLIAGLETGRFEIAFPRRMVWSMKALSLLPYPLFFWAVRRITGA